MNEEMANYAANKAFRKLGIKEEPGTVLTCDGNYDGTLVMGSLPACKVSDNPVDLNSMESLVLNYENGDTRTLTASDWVVQTDSGVQALVSIEQETPLVLSFSADMDGTEKGVYVTYAPEWYVERVIFLGTITPISDKYLPGPVVIDLDKYGDTPINTILETLAFSGGGTAQATGIGSLFTDLDTNSPVVFKFTLSSFGVVFFASGATIIRDPDEDMGVTDFTFSCVGDLGGTIARVSVFVTFSGKILVTVEPITTVA